MDHCSRVTSRLFPARRSLGLKPAGYYHNFAFVFIRFLFVFIACYLPIYSYFTVFARRTSTTSTTSVSSHRASSTTTHLSLCAISPIPCLEAPYSHALPSTEAQGKDSHERCRCVPFSQALQHNWDDMEPFRSASSVRVSKYEVLHRKGFESAFHLYFYSCLVPYGACGRRYGQTLHARKS